MDDRTKQVHEFARQYTAAWCSQDAGSVASFFSPDGSLTINDGVPAIGREAITEAAQSFMTSLPDLEVTMDALVPQGDKFIYKWSLTGTNLGPGGTGRSVAISGFEVWRIDDNDLIAESLGHFDSEDYNRQLGIS